MNGVGAMEICVSACEGVCDFISAMDTPRIQEWNTWYHLLNCGFPIAVSGETDFPCMSSRRVGQGRVYVQLGAGAELNFDEWWWRVSPMGSLTSPTGYAHALEFTVGGRSPALDEAVDLEAPGSVPVRAMVAFAPATPETVAQGLVTPRGGKVLVGDTVNLHAERNESMRQGGRRKVELIVNGAVVAAQMVPADGAVHELDFGSGIPISESSWVALRQLPQLHTNPVIVKVAGKPVRASARSARWCARDDRTAVGESSWQYR